MKKTILFCLIAMLCFLNQMQAQTVSKRGLFVSVIENSVVLTSREEMTRLIDFSRSARVDTLFVQVYRSGKAWFPSEHADSEPYNDAAKKVGEDPLALLIRLAHAQKIEVHAWVNMLSLSDNEKAPLLKKYGPEILTQKPGPKKKKLRDYKIDNQFFLEPADWRVREETSQIIEEIVKAYPELDGVQLDYIRYPDSHPFYGYSPESIARFKQMTGESDISESNLKWKDWRRRQVTELVEILKRRASAIHPGIQFTTTGCAPYSRAIHECFQDWPAWGSSGLANFVTVMTYPPDVETFEKYLKNLKEKSSFEKVNIAIGAYKLTDKPDIFQKQFEVCEKAGARGCVVFYYGVLRDHPELAKVLKRDKVAWVLRKGS